MNHTIAAISTPYGRGGIAVIRISGDEAIEIAEKMFKPFGSVRLSEIEGGRCVYGEIIKRGRRIDDGLCTVFRAPRSFTGEDTVEISCHGGILLTERVLEAAFECGASQAGAGEFTKRAFINGKLSLSQAEAIGMLIDAENDAKLELAVSQSGGAFRKKADELYESLKTIVTGVYANVDFPDEDLAELSSDELISAVSGIKAELQALSDSYRFGRAVCEGIQTVLIGKPNTGKSSLLNRLTGRERAIVTDIAGTTRDTIEETVMCGRVMLKLSDTAGIRETGDAVELLGVERSLKALDESELVIAVFDSSRELDREDEALLEKMDSAGKTKIAVLNKKDLPRVIDTASLEKHGFSRIMSICAAETDDIASGIGELKKYIEELYASGGIDYNSTAVLTNARQNASVTRALEYVTRAESVLLSGMPSDTAGFDLEAALSELSELDGRRVTEEIVDSIFHRFCVGK